MNSQKDSKWIIPPEKLQESLTSKVSFLWNDDYTYIMDNHLLAAWCWSQRLRKGQKFSIIHIDAHNDLGRIAGKYGKEFPPFHKLSLKEYLDLEVEILSSYKQKALQWDNYFTLFLDQYNEYAEKIIISTHEKINDGEFIIDSKLESYNLIHFLKNELPNSKNWIINIDIDYFYYNYYDGNHRRHYIPLFSEYFIQELSDTLLEYKNHILSLTIALSPECCGGWENANKICSFIVDRMKIDFSLPINDNESEKRGKGVKYIIP